MTHLEQISTRVEVGKIDNNYFIDTCGNVYSRPRPKIGGGLLPQFVNAYGYLYVKFRHDGKPKTKLVHRLLAEVFIPNPKGLPAVNHVDGDKGNNDLSNLEWCTHSENQNHAWKTGLQKRLSNTGQRYIYRDDETGNYRVVIPLKGGKKLRYRRTTTLSQAMKIRNKALADILK